ncbi:MAG TPA: type II toxin-antitoxin system Phd/YefM family antitoxin [Terriglobales bacterium]|nr:type II toxin-antitoxin system Phd/YefM family antitoxin [Terriglobales bacterium]
MKTIPAAQFKAHCLKVMDEVNFTRQSVLITKKGKPVARLVPADTAPHDVFDCLKGVFEIVGDIESPAVPAEDWETIR